jgi:hypothetical protein
MPPDGGCPWTIVPLIAAAGHPPGLRRLFSPGKSVFVFNALALVGVVGLGVRTITLQSED